MTESHLTALGEAWQRVADETVASWRADAEPGIINAVLLQVASAVRMNDPGALAQMSTNPTSIEVGILETGARSIAAAGQASVVAEAKAAGCDLGSPQPLATTGLAGWASIAAELLTSGLVLGMAREALRAWRPGASGTGIAETTRAYAAGLADRPVRDIVGGLLTRAQNLGRLAVYRGPRPPRWHVRLFADETLDKNTCGPCERIDGTELPTAEAAGLAYGGAGYLFCEGRERCRGTMRGEWTQVRPADSFALLGEILDGRHYKRDRKGRFSETDEQKLAAVVKAAKALDPDSESWHRLTGGASGSGVRMAVLPDGRRVVRKQAPDWGSDEPATQAHAEYLASLTGGALDVPVALVQHDGAGPAAWVEHHSGPTLPGEDGATTPAEKALGQTYAAWRETGAAVRMGLLDVLIGNTDRNEGNLIIGEHEVIGIDHAFAFEMVAYQHGTPHPGDLADMGGDHAPARHFISRDVGRNAWRDNPMTPGDVIETRSRLEALRSVYVKAGRERWLDNALLMLDQLGEHAGGTESIYD